MLTHRRLPLPAPDPLSSEPCAPPRRRLHRYRYRLRLFHRRCRVRCCRLRIQDFAAHRTVSWVWGLVRRRRYLRPASPVRAAPGARALLGAVSDPRGAPGLRVVHRAQQYEPNQEQESDNTPAQMRGSNDKKRIARSAATYITINDVLRSAAGSNQTHPDELSTKDLSCPDVKCVVTTTTSASKSGRGDRVVHVFDCFECAIHALAPTCKQCGVRVLGHGVEVAGFIFCCANCAEAYGVHGSPTDGHVVASRVTEP